MRCKKSALKSAALSLFGTTLLATAAWAQIGGQGGAPWRGAGAQPYFGPASGTSQCPTGTAAVVAVRAGRLFDSKSGQMLTNQIVLITGERITDVGANVQIPPGAQVLDLSQATVMPGLIDAHTHMFNGPKPGMSRETSTMIAIHNLQADL